MMKLLSTFILWSLLFSQLNAQGISFFGNTYLGDEGALYVDQLSVNFQGKVKTSVTENHGKLVLGLGSTVENAATNAFVDGFVQSHFNGNFSFPIGEGEVYAPFEINSASEISLTSRYNFSQAPNNSELSEELESVSADEFWNLKSEDAASVKLAWKQNSNISTLTGNDLTKLRIVGWNDEAQRWEIIAHQEPVAGNLIEGNITSLNNIEFSKFSIITFGSEGEDLGVSELDISSVNLIVKNGHLLAISTQQPISQILFYDMSGRVVAQHQSINGLRFQNIFPHPKAVYIARIILTDGTIINKKIINQ